MLIRNHTWYTYKCTLCFYLQRQGNLSSYLHKIIPVFLYLEINSDISDISLKCLYIWYFATSENRSKSSKAVLLCRERFNHISKNDWMKWVSLCINNAKAGIFSFFNNNKKMLSYFIYLCFFQFRVCLELPLTVLLTSMII